MLQTLGKIALVFSLFRSQALHFFLRFMQPRTAAAREERGVAEAMLLVSTFSKLERRRVQFEQLFVIVKAPQHPGKLTPDMNRRAGMKGIEPLREIDSASNVHRIILLQ